jgi:hypothetical protein
VALGNIGPQANRFSKTRPGYFELARLARGITGMKRGVSLFGGVMILRL